MKLKSNNFIVANKDILPIIFAIISALSTVGLALITWLYVDETHKMAIATGQLAKDTKRLADLSQEQFKIRAYPSFVVTAYISKINNDKIQCKFEMSNQGEIAAHKFSSFLVLVYQKNSIHKFINMTGLLYKGPSGEKKVIDLEVNVPPNSNRTLTSSWKPQPGYTVKDLRYELLFLKFWVPYDVRYRYETFGYILKKDLQNEEFPFKWQEITKADKERLQKEYVNELTADGILYNKLYLNITNFFSDYSKDVKQ